MVFLLSYSLGNMVLFFHFSLGPLMCKETIRNNWGLIVLRIRNHHSMRTLSSADCVLAAKCRETTWGLSFGFCF